MCPTLTNLLVIIVGGIPIAMPTVLSVTLALGASQVGGAWSLPARSLLLQLYSTPDAAPRAPLSRPPPPSSPSTARSWRA
jgi:hypothetical protein